MKLVTIGVLASDQVLEKLKAKGYRNFSAQQAQKNIISGIEEILDTPIDIISSFDFHPYPECKDLFSKKIFWKGCNGSVGVGVSSLNIKYASIIVRTHNIKKTCQQWALQHKEEDIVVFVYSAINSFLQGAFEIKKICPKTRIYLIITDLPQYMDLNQTIIKRILKKIDWLSLRKCIASCDGWILFSKHMADFLNLPIERCLVMEGSISNQECLNSLLKESKKTEKHGKNISILYSGSLNMKYGIPELIEGFGMIDADDYELWFAGTGDAKEYIESKASKDSRIKYFGYIPRREDLLDMQRNATMLFNTRLPGEKASLYCFPSKLFEFLLSGRPVLSYKIGGIPDEYFNYLIEVKSSTPCDIKNAICYVAQMSETEREKIGLAGRNYVIEEKNSLKQAKRICEFIGL